jgi:hypothetical protein
MKKNNFRFVIFLILAMLVVPIFTFVSCDNGTTSQGSENPNTPSVDSDGDDKEDDKTQDEEQGWNSSSFIGDWQQNTHETTITINDNGTFSLASSIDSFNGLTGTYENYIADDSSSCSRVSFNGLDGTYILTMIEDDVFEIALPNDMGGTCTFVKKRTENIDVKGRWESETLSYPIEFAENTYTIYKTNGDAVENGSGSYTMDGNSFSADGNYGFTGLLAQSGNSYVYALWQDAIYTKVTE